MTIIIHLDRGDLRLPSHVNPEELTHATLYDLAVAHWPTEGPLAGAAPSSPERFRLHVSGKILRGTVTLASCIFGGLEASDDVHILGQVIPDDVRLRPGNTSSEKRGKVGGVSRNGAPRGSSCGCVVM